MNPARAKKRPRPPEPAPAEPAPQVDEQAPGIGPGRSAFASLRREVARLKDSILSLETLIHAAEVGEAGPLRSDMAPRVNEAGFAIEHAGKTCFLGNTTSFRLAAKLLEQPGRYYTNRELETAVWQARVSAGTIRSAVHWLRQALARADMAIDIDGARNAYAAVPAATKNTTDFEQKSNR